MSEGGATGEEAARTRKVVSALCMIRYKDIIDCRRLVESFSKHRHLV